MPKRHRLPKPGDHENLRAVVWGALNAASRLTVDETATADERIRACHAVASLSASYARLMREKPSALDELLDELGG